MYLSEDLRKIKSKKREKLPIVHLPMIIFIILFFLALPFSLPYTSFLPKLHNSLHTFNFGIQN